MYILNIQIIDAIIVVIGFAASILLSFASYDTVVELENSIKAYALVSLVFFGFCGFFIVTFLMKPLTIDYFGWSKVWAHIAGYAFHFIIIAFGAVPGLLKRHDVI